MPRKATLHPEREKTMFNEDLYNRTLQAVAVDHPDFYMTSGDDFSVDTLATFNIANVIGRYTLQVPYLSQVGQSSPLFLVNGNHEQAARYLLDGTPNNVAVWAQNARDKYFPQPAPDGFYSGNTEVVPYIGLLRDYYAWEWGDALFVVIDPYWSSPVPVDSVLGDKGPKTRNEWDITHGDAQYQWLMTIHQLLVANHVTIFFQGHDHLFAHQQLDGVVYQELPNPADNTYTAFNVDAYTSGETFPNAGYVKVTVSPDAVSVQYICMFLPGDEAPPDKVSGMVQFSYTIPAQP